MPTRQPLPSDMEDAQPSVQLKAQRRLREMILAGELAAGTRIAELAIVEKLGFSRTPIRTALMRLEQEGLLNALPNGGYAVKSFSERDVSEAIELRGTIEGLMVRLAAERGADPSRLSDARACLCAMDTVLVQPMLDDEAFASYVNLNEKFHALLGEMADSPVLMHELGRVCSMPFASPSAFVMVQAHSDSARDLLVVAQDQHWQVLAAIQAREGTRAEGLMREHSRIARRNLHDAVQNADLAQMPGARLIRRPD